MKKSKYIKLILLILVITLFIFALIGCGEKEINTQKDSNIKSEKNTEVTDEIKKDLHVGSKIINNENTKNVEDKLMKMYSDTDKYENHEVEFKSRISSDPAPTPNNSGMMFYCHPYGNEKLITYIVTKDRLDLNNGDIIHIKGKLMGTFKDGDMSTPFVLSDNTNKAEDLSAPEVKIVKVNKEINKDGYIVRVHKVEFTEGETIAYISVTNNTDNEISFYNSSAKASQGANQLETKSIYKKGYEEIKSEILPGVTEDGVVIFSKADTKEPLTIYLKGGWVDPFVFEVK